MAKAGGSAAEKPPKYVIGDETLIIIGDSKYTKLVSKPPKGMQAVLNIYYDPTIGRVVVEVSDEEI